jgi:hypothetical protein
MLHDTGPDRRGNQADHPGYRSNHHRTVLRHGALS